MDLSPTQHVHIKLSMDLNTHTACPHQTIHGPHHPHSMSASNYPWTSSPTHHVRIKLSMDLITHTACPHQTIHGPHHPHSMSASNYPWTSSPTQHVRIKLSMDLITHTACPHQTIHGPHHPHMSASNYPWTSSPTQHVRIKLSMDLITHTTCPHQTIFGSCQCITMWCIRRVCYFSVHTVGVAVWFSEVWTACNHCHCLLVVFQPGCQLAFFCTASQTLLYIRGLCFTSNSY